MVGGLLAVGSRPCRPVSVQPLLPISGEFSPTQHVLPPCGPAQTDQSRRSVNAIPCAELLVKIAVTCPGAPAWSRATDLGKRWRAGQPAPERSAQPADALSQALEAAAGLAAQHI